MEKFNNFVRLLQGTMERPSSYGWFHLMFIAIVLVASVFFAIFAKKCSDKAMRLTVLVSWLIIFFFEIYKQLVMNFDGTKWMNYQWYIFPYQFCSTPLYVMPLVFALKDCKVRKAAVAYLAYYAFFAGITVFCYPEGVFTYLTGINIQTLVHHGIMVTTGVFLMSYLLKDLKLMDFFYSVALFAVLIAIAMVFNLTLKKFNAFFISPYFTCELPVFNVIQAKAPYIIFLLSYVLGFSICAFVMYGIAWLINFTKKKIKKA